MSDPRPYPVETAPIGAEQTPPAPGTEQIPPAPAPPLRRTFAQRLVAAMKLDATLYEEVEHDPDALPQAAGVVALAAIAGAVAMVGLFGVSGILSGLVQAFVSWVLWTAIVWFVGVQVFKHTSDFGELLRTLGFVAAPQILMVIAILPIPLLARVLSVVVLVMTVIAFVRALRTALDVDTMRALLVAVLAVLAQVLVVGAIGALVA